MSVVLPFHPFPGFPYTLDDAPTNDWTIEERLQWQLLQDLHALELEREAQLREFDEDWDVRMQSLQDALQTLEQQQQQPPEQELVVLEKNASSAAAPNAVVGVQAVAPPLAPRPPRQVPTAYTLHLLVLQGLHTNTTFALHFAINKTNKKKHHVAWIGRSKGQKFVAPHGVSLHRDARVSTSHGKFELCHVMDVGEAIEAQFCLDDAYVILYTDTNSSNGSYLNDGALQPDLPVPLSAQDILLVGDSYLQVMIEHHY